MNASERVKAHWILRVSASMCFIGHGAFGIITKTEWLRYFLLGKIPPVWAYHLMPVIGTIDIMMAVLLLFYPCVPVLLWMIFWTLFTALLRPLAGESGWEAMERAGNYGVPIAFLALSGWFENKQTLLQKINSALVSAQAVELAKTILTVTTALLLIGHGGCMAVMKKKIFEYQLLQTGLRLPEGCLVWTGFAEMAMGLAVFLWNLPKLLLFIVFWKVATELFYPASGAPVWEFIERFGSYGAPLSLYFLSKNGARPDDRH